MTSALAKQKAVSAVFDASHHILNDQTVAQIIVCDLIIILTNGRRFAVLVKLKSCVGEARDHDVGKGSLFSLLLCVHMIADAAKVHVKNRMMAVLPLWRSGQTVDMLCGDIFQNLLKADGRDVVAFVHDNHTVVSEPGLYFVGIAHGLQHGDINDPAASVFIGSIQADDFPLFLSSSALRLWRQNFVYDQKLLQSFLPL